VAALLEAFRFGGGHLRHLNVPCHRQGNSSRLCIRLCVARIFLPSLSVFARSARALTGCDQRVA
jgi:hypothetical protein